MLQALDDAKLDWREGGSLANLNLQRCGILIGTAMGGMQTFATAVEDLVTKASPSHMMLSLDLKST